MPEYNLIKNGIYLCTFHVNCKNPFKYQKYLRGLIALLLSASLFFFIQNGTKFNKFTQIFYGQLHKIFIGDLFFFNEASTIT